MRWLKENDETKYLELKKELLPDGGKAPKYESNEIQHLAKQIRNRFYNPNKIKQVGYNRRIPAKEQLAFKFA